jgi:hypothetical protein
VNKKNRRLAKKAKGSSGNNPDVTDPVYFGEAGGVKPTNPDNAKPLETDPTAIVDHAKDLKDVAMAQALPARPIKNSVSGKGASATFKGVGTMKEHGIPAGLRRNEFQDRVLAWNEESGAHLNDDNLASIFDAEFPQGGVRIADRPELVNVIRKFYNAGKHGKQQGGVIPTTLSTQYGQPVKRTDTVETPMNPPENPISDDSEDEPVSKTA